MLLLIQVGCGVCGFHSCRFYYWSIRGLETERHETRFVLARELRGRRAVHQVEAGYLDFILKRQHLATDE